MTEQQSEYITDALDMLGKGYEIHPPQRVIKSDKNGKPVEVREDAWVKISMAFLETMRNLKGARLSVWMAIALRIDDNYVSYPSIAKMQKDTGLSNREIIDTVRELEKEGYLTVKNQRGHNVYQILSYAAFGAANPVIPGSEVSSPVNSGADLVNSGAGIGEETSLKQDVNETKQDLSKITEKANKTFEGIIKYSLSPKAIQEALAKYFKLTPNFEAKYNRQWMQWAMENNVTPGQIELAADTWKNDKRFNWKMYDLKGIQEHWLELIAEPAPAEPLPPYYQPFVPEPESPNKMSHSQWLEWKKTHGEEGDKHA